MKIPRTPPKPVPLSTSKLEGLEDSDPKYRHWDILRHLQPPAGLTHEEWWSGLKILRSFGRRKLPLKGFSYILPHNLFPCLHLLEEMTTGIEEERLNRFHFLSEEAISSSQIEGAATTRIVAKEMLRSGRLPRDTSEQMIFNNYLMMQRLREWKDESLSIELICEIHKVVCTKTLEKTGQFRQKSDHVEVIDVTSGEVLHRPPGASTLKRQMKELCIFANTSDPEMPPLIKAIILHFWFAYVHPFVDGNGRTARALFYWYLIRQEYWLFEYLSISDTILKAPSRYAEAFLYSETDDGDLTYFLIHQIDAIQKALTSLNRYGRRERDLSSLGVNMRQEALLLHALKNCDSVYTVTGHQNSHSVVYETARSDLLELVGLGFLELSMRGRAYIFRPSQKLASML
ncbi:MAG: Fic family protein [Chlamydiae bacterium]|nr:hypothetical protein [Chlamydiales bacterium]MCH9703980.1 Fic family protein [Chlamydiota bacterium]